MHRHILFLMLLITLLFTGVASAEIGIGLGETTRNFAATVTVPEPASIAMIGSGLLALGGMLKRRLGK